MVSKYCVILCLLIADWNCLTYGSAVLRNEALTPSLGDERPCKVYTIKSGQGWIICHLSDPGNFQRLYSLPF
jgi:hypothetical protein